MKFERRLRAQNAPDVAIVSSGTKALAKFVDDSPARFGTGVKKGRTREMGDEGERTGLILIF